MCTSIYFFAHVLKPKGKYSGHVPTKDVATKTTPNTKRIIPIVPVMIPVK